MAQTTITLTNQFADDTTRNLVIGPFTTSSISISNIRQAVKDLNDNPAAISSLYLSNSGASFTRVKQVKLSTANKTIII